MGKTRNRYSDDFKRDAVNHLLSSGKSVAEVSKNLGIELYNLARWKNMFLMEKPESKSQTETPAEKVKRLEKENSQLTREVIQLKQEREILKKAMGIVSKQ